MVSMFQAMATTFLVLVLTVLAPADRWPKGFRGEAPARIDRVDIVDKGIYTAEILEIIPDPQSATGTRERIGNVALQLDTTTIPRIKHTHFGFRYSLKGAPAGATVVLKIVIIYPDSGQRGHRTGATHYRDEFMLTQPIADGPFSCANRIDADTALGLWKFQVWIDQRMLAEQTFNVVRP
jgi:hypothetical protein